MAQISLAQATPLLTTEAVMGFLERSQPGTFLKTFFPSRTITSKQIKVPYGRVIRRIAQDIPRGAGPNLGGANKSIENIYTPPYFGEGVNVTELDVYDVFYDLSTQTFNDNMIPLIAEKVTEEMILNNDALVRAENLQIAQTMLTGTVTATSQDDIEYDRTTSTTIANPASIITLAAGEKWDVNDNNAYNSINAVLNYMRSEGKISNGGSINCILGTQAKEHLVRNPVFKEQIDLRRDNRAELNQVRLNSDGASYHGRITVGDYTLDLWTFQDSYVNPTTGEDTKYIGEKDVVLIPENWNASHGEMVYAGVPMIPNHMSDTVQNVLNTLQGMFPGRVVSGYTVPQVDAWVIGLKTAFLSTLKAPNSIGTLREVLS